MSDEPDFLGLRKNLVRLADPPPVDELVRRGAARRARRRAQIAVISAVLVVAIAVPVWFGVRTQHTPSAGPQTTSQASSSSATSRSSDTAPTPTPTTPRALTTVPYPAGPWGSAEITDPQSVGSPVTFDFADPRHAFAVRQACSGKTCTTTLLVTTDGRTWTTRTTPMPTDNPTEGRYPSLVVFGGERLLLTENSVGYSGRAWFSGDAGRSWTAVPSSTSATTEAGATGAPLVLQCQGEAVTTCPLKVAALSPTTGRPAVLAHQPPLSPDRAITAYYPEADGSIWVTGTRANGAPAASVTRDGGRTWRLSTFDLEKSSIWATAVSGAGRILYATVVGERPEVKNGLLAIYQSADSGVTWTKIFSADTAPPQTMAATPTTSLGVPIVQPDGGLDLIGEDGSAWRTFDGRTFLKISSPGFVWAYRAGGGYLLSDGGRSAAVSVDGLTWKRLTIPST